MNKKRIIGLTGGIATGKSTVANYLAQNHGLLILDADLFAREAVEPETNIFQSIIERYGTQILLTDGQLNRQKLGDIIFFNPVEKQWLEQQIHPFVRDRFLWYVENFDQPATLVFVIPLLFEAEMTDLVTESWVVYCLPHQQIDRLMRRNNLTLTQAEARINSQMSLAEKCDRATVILDNSREPTQLFPQIDLALCNSLS